MTMLQERPTTEVTRTPQSHRPRLVEMVVGAIGLLAAAVGAWMYFVPADWFLGGLAEGYHLGMLMGAGLLLAGAFGFSAYQDLEGRSGWTRQAVASTVLALLMLAGGVTAGLVYLI